MKMIGLIILASLVGCSSLSKNECMRGDWQTVGYQDGSKGYIAGDRMNSHNKACNEYGVHVNRSVYLQGYQSGLIAYCTPHKGFEVGLHGNYYGNVCPKNLEYKFMQGLVIGKEANLYQREIDAIEEKIKVNEEVIDKWEDDNGITINEPTRIRMIRADIRILEAEKGTLEAKINLLRSRASFI